MPVGSLSLIELKLALAKLFLEQEKALPIEIDGGRDDEIDSEVNRPARIFSHRPISVSR